MHCMGVWRGYAAISQEPGPSSRLEWEAMISRERGLSEDECGGLLAVHFPNGAKSCRMVPLSLGWEIQAGCENSQDLRVLSLHGPTTERP
jgi:hypothetical protein